MRCRPTRSDTAASAESDFFSQWKSMENVPPPHNASLSAVGLRQLGSRALGEVEDAPQPVLPGRASGDRYAGLGREEVEAVEGAGPDVQFGLASRGPETGGVLHHFVAKHLGRT